MQTKKLGFGFMRLPLINQDQSKINFEELNKMVDLFIENGSTYFDTAYFYHNGKSESALRKSLVERYSRDKFLIADKLPVFLIKTEKDKEIFFNEQLEKCGVEYFDYYLLHALNKPNYNIAEKFDVFNFVLEKKKQGKIKKIGFSFHDNAELLDKILQEHPEVEFVQLQINYLDWENENIQSRKCYEVAKKHNKEIIVMEPVKGGMLANVSNDVKDLFENYDKKMSPASWAIRYVTSLEGVSRVLSGMSNLEQIKDNISYMKNFKPLTQEEKEIIKKAIEKIKSKIAIPCTVCQYCLKKCPKKIPIPNYFSLYNDEKATGKKDISIYALYYSNLIKDNSKASDCIECKKCEAICPQKIEITKELKRVVEEFER